MPCWEGRRDRWDACSRASGGDYVVAVPVAAMAAVVDVHVAVADVDVDVAHPPQLDAGCGSSVVDSYHRSTNF